MSPRWFSARRLFLKRRIRILVLTALGFVAFVGSSTLAAGGVKSIMRAWKADSAVAVQMATGRMSLDAARLRGILQGFVSGTKDIEARISGSSAASKDLKVRFAQFEADSTATLSALGQESQLKSSISRVLSNCKACHDVHAN